MTDKFTQTIKDDYLLMFRWTTGNEIFKFLNRENEDTLWDYVDRFIARRAGDIKFNVFGKIFWDRHRI
jgi:hypothetical protein